MHDFGKIVYQDMYKTGSTAVSRFLRQCCRHEEVAFKKHAPVGETHRPNTFYFTTIRNPYALYKSLYRYGCGKKGNTYTRLTRLGMENLYEPTSENYNAWISFITNDENLVSLYPRFKGATRLGMGIMSTRHMMYSVLNPFKEIKGCKTIEEVKVLQKEKNINDLIILNEELNDGLRKLSTEMMPRAFKQKRARAFLDSPESARINQSKVGDPNALVMTEESMAAIKSREKLILDRYYPDL